MSPFGLTKEDRINESDTIIKNMLAQTIKKHKNGAVLMLELPVENYFEANSAQVKFLTENNYEGIYVSFQRPLENILSLFKQNHVDIDKFLIIDEATAFSEENLEIDEIVKTICKSLKDIKSKKKFVLIDSLTTVALYKKSVETTRFLERLVSEVKKHNVENVTFLFNVAKELSEKNFVQDIALTADEVINVGRYSKNDIHVGLCT